MKGVNETTNIESLNKLHISLYEVEPQFFWS